MRTCARCGRTFEHAEGLIDGKDYCHFDPYPTCYMRAQWELSGAEIITVGDLIAEALGEPVDPAGPPEVLVEQIRRYLRRQ